MFVSPSSKYVEFARQGLSAKEVAALTGCSRGTAREALQRAREDILDRMSDNAQAAVALFDRSSLTQSVLRAEGVHIPSKRRWEDVALGIYGGN